MRVITACNISTCFTLRSASFSGGNVIQFRFRTSPIVPDGGSTHKNMEVVSPFGLSSPPRLTTPLGIDLGHHRNV
jgi:hypothetical protein